MGKLGGSAVIGYTRRVRVTGEEGGAPPWSAKRSRRSPGHPLNGGACMSDPTDIYNWRRLDSRVTTSGQPTEEQLAELSRLGIGHVINLGLHTHEKALPDEAASLARLGLTYIHIPVDFDRPTEEDFNKFCDAMAKLESRPVHVHCIANMRVSAFLYRWQREALGHNDAQARALMDTVWQPGGVWASFIGDDASSSLSHRLPK